MDFDTLVDAARTRLRVKVSRRENSNRQFATDVLAGLTASPKCLSPKYFYDTTGSQLFEEICNLPEYYPTRTERGILQQNADEIAQDCDHDMVLVEFGSGSSSKTRLLIEAFLQCNRRLHYMPIDISKSMLIDSAKALLNRYPELMITALVSDYLVALQAIPHYVTQNKLIVFLGSSIGNFDNKDAVAFLQAIRATMTENDRLLIGMDMLKSSEILVPAYDDAQGVTARFNLNLLTRINRELGGRFDLSRFRHKALFNQGESRIEMHIESLENQSVEIRGIARTITFARGETLHTENSYKYSRQSIQQMAARSGFAVVQHWYDEQDWFSLNLFVPL